MALAGLPVTNCLVGDKFKCRRYATELFCLAVGLLFFQVQLVDFAVERGPADAQ